MPTLSEHQPRIMIVEDNDQLAEFITEILGELGEVRVSANGRAALHDVRDWRPNVILSDVMMPGIDGLELCRRLKAEPETASIPFVLISGIAYTGTKSGADEYISKPFHPNDLRDRVQRLLDR